MLRENPLLLSMEADRDYLLVPYLLVTFVLLRNSHENPSVASSDKASENNNFKQGLTCEYLEDFVRTSHLPAHEKKKTWAQMFYSRTHLMMNGTAPSLLPFYCLRDLYQKLQMHFSQTFLPQHSFFTGIQWIFASIYTGIFLLLASSWAISIPGSCTKGGVVQWEPCSQWRAHQNPLIDHSWTSVTINKPKPCHTHPKLTFSHSSHTVTSVGKEERGFLPDYH